MGRSAASAARLALALLALVSVFGFADRAAAAGLSPSPQALRTCVDRWNRGNMRSWGSRRVWISIRGLSARERSNLVIPHPLQPRCTLSLVSGDNSWICYIQAAGGYDCPLITSDGMPPVRHPNGRTDRRGILRLDTPLAGTHATPPLAWQRLYPHVDGFIFPWTRAGALRRGLRFDRAAGRHYRGTCSLGSQHTHAKGALRCFSDVRFDPCFGPPGNWNHRGATVACGGPGYTSFSRFAIVRRS